MAKKKQKDTRLAIGSLRPTGLDEHTEKCFDCGRTVYVSDDWSSYNLDAFSCMECMVRLNANDSKLIVTDETAKFFGMTKKELTNIAEIQIANMKEKIKSEAIAG